MCAMCNMHVHVHVHEDMDREHGMVGLGLGQSHAKMRPCQQRVFFVFFSVDTATLWSPHDMI